jgi:hypothetical protein
VVTLTHRDHVEDRRAAIVKFGSSLRPWVIGLDGYRQHGDPHVIDAKVLWTVFYRPEQADQGSLFVTVTTDASTTAVCGAPLRAETGTELEQQEKTCRQSGDTWRRTSQDRHEVALVAGDLVVRVAASGDVTENELIDVARSVRPMSDDYYRHALFGEDGQYIPALDGAR